MTTKTDIKKLLSKGGLTGKEAGKLILQDNWLVDHAKEGFLSERDIQSIKASMKSTKDIEDYNSYISTYRFIDYTLKEAHIVALTLGNRINALTRLLLMYFFDSSSDLELHTKPVIMTEKEYQDHKASQKAYILKELTDLHEILDWRARELASDEIKGQESEDSYSFFDWTREAYPEIWRQALTDILELLRSGKLRPVVFTGEAKEKLDTIWNMQRELRDQDPIITTPQEDLVEKTLSGEIGQYDSARNEEAENLSKQADKLLLDLFKAGKKRQKSQRGLIASLEKLLAGSLSEEDENSLLYYAYCSGEDLYQTGLPEWIRWIEEYKPGYTSTTRGEDMIRGVAILTDPSPSQVDKNGYYKPLRIVEDILTSDKHDVLTSFQEGTKMLREEARAILSFLSVAEAVSTAIGIDFAEDIRCWIKDMDQEVRIYNLLRVRALALENIPEEVKDAIQPINLEKQKPSAKTVKYLQERIALGLGEGWWEDVKTALRKDYKEKEALNGQED